jgi:hypothetical protein
MRTFRGAYLLLLSDFVRRFDLEWKLDAATGSLDCGFIEEDATTCAVDDESGDGQAEAGSAVRGNLMDSASEETLEDAGVFSWGDTGTGIVDAEAVKGAVIVLVMPIDDSQSRVIGREFDCVMKHVKKSDADEAAVSDERIADQFFVFLEYTDVPLLDENLEQGKDLLNKAGEGE